MFLTYSFFYLSFHFNTPCSDLICGEQCRLAYDFWLSLVIVWQHYHEGKRSRGHGEWQLAAINVSSSKWCLILGSKYL